MRDHRTTTRARPLRRRLIAALAAAGALVMSSGIMVLSTAEAQANGDGSKKVEICHATDSETNPYVFIEVSVNAVKDEGHLAHRTDPNKTWNADTVWNDVFYPAGSARRDYINDYTDSDGVFHALDGSIVSESWCESAPLHAVTAVLYTATDPTCEADGALVPAEQPDGVIATQDPAGTGPGTYTITFTAEEGYAIVGQTTQTITVEPMLTGPQCGDLVVVTTTAPTFTEPTCETLDGAAVTLPEDTEAVDYEQTGVAGFGETVTVTATVTDPATYVFAEDAVTEWTHTFVTLESLACEEVLPTETASPTETEPAAEPPEVLGTEAAVPTAVDAGLGGPTTGSGSASVLLGASLVGAGLALLVGAGWLALGRRPNGAHQI